MPFDIIQIDPKTSIVKIKTKKYFDDIQKWYKWSSNKNTYIYQKH